MGSLPDEFFCPAFFCSEKQRHLGKIREKLAAQMKQAVDDEDDRIGNAIGEAEDRHRREEEEKQQKMVKLRKEMTAHRLEQVRLIVLIIQY